MDCRDPSILYPGKDTALTVAALTNGPNGFFQLLSLRLPIPFVTSGKPLIQSSKIATARAHPPPAFSILTGKTATLNPMGLGILSKLVRFSM